MTPTLYHANLFAFCGKSTRALGLVFLLLIVGFGRLSAVTILVPTDQPTINAAIAAASPGDVILLENDITEGLIAVNKLITLDGGGFTLTSTSGTFGIYLTVAGAGATVQNITVSNSGTFGVANDPGADNIVLSNVTVTNSGGSGFAIACIDGAMLTNVTATNNGGNGLSLTNVTNLSINGLTTSGNTFGFFSAGIGIFTTALYCGPGAVNGLSLSGTISIDEPVKAYSQKTVASQTISGLSGGPLVFAVQTDALTRSYWPNLADAYAAAAAGMDAPFFFSNDNVCIEELATGNYFVNDDPNGDAMPPMKIAPAIANIVSGNTIHIESGTYAENVDIAAPGKDIRLAPGASPGCVTITGNITLDAGDVLDMEIDGTTPCSGHDQFIVKGTVTLGGASLALTISHSFSPADQVTLIDNDDTDAISGTFAEGSSVTVGGTTYLIRYTGGTGNDVTLSRLCGDACGATTFTGNTTISTQTQLNAFKNGSGCKYTEVTGNLTIDGNGNASTGGDAPGSDPITNLCNLTELVTVGGNLIIRDFNVAGNPTSLDALANLQSVGGNLTIGSTNANDNNGSFVGTLSLPAVNAVGGTLTVNQNPNISAIDIPTAFSAGSGAVSVLNNTSVSSINLGVSSTTGNAAINTNGTGVTSISMPNLTMVGGNLDLGNAAAHLTLATLSFPVLNSVSGFLELRRTATGTVSFPVLTQVTGNLIIAQNEDLSDISIPGPFTGSTNSVSIENNAGSSTLTSIVLGVLSTVTDLAVQTNGTTLATVNLDKLTSVGRHLDMNNAAAHDVSATANVNLSALTTVGGRLRFVRAVNAISIGNLTTSGTDGALSLTNRAFTFQRNAIVDLDAAFPSFASVGGNLSVTNNTNLSQCCIIPCKLTTGGSTSVSANTGNCATLAIATAACAPTVSDFTLTETSGTTDDGELCHDGTDITLDATASTTSGALNYEFFVDADDDNELDMGETVLYDGPDNVFTFSEAMLGGTGSFKLSVRVTVGGGCEAYPATNLTVVIHDVPVANNAMLMLCSTDPGGTTADFDLSEADDDVTGAAMGVTVTYHATQDDADNNVNALSSLYNSADATIYARVENSSAVYCYATSEVTLSVKPTPNAGTITSGERLICENGDPVGFTATAVAGTTYQWQFSQDNGMNWSNATGSGGVTSQNYNIPNGGVPDPEVTTLYRRQVTSNGNGCTNVSNSVTVYVNTFDLGTVNSGTPQTICVGDAVNPIDVTAPTTISAPGLLVTTTYQWQQSANGTSGWSNIAGADQEDYTPTGLTATRYFRRIVTVTVDGSAIPTNPTSVSCSKTPATWQAVVFVNVINPGTINMGSASNTRTICEGGDAGVFNAPAATVPAGATRTYLWQYRAKGSMDPWVDAPAPNDVEDYDAPAGSILFDAEFQRIVYSELNGVSCEAITINNPTIDINEIMDEGMISYTGDPDFNVCAGTTPLPFNGTAAAADGTIAYQWRSSTTTNVPPLSSNVAGGTSQDLTTPPNMPAHPGVLHIARRITSTLNGVSCVAFTNVITLETDPLPVNPTVTPSGVQSFCTDAASVDVNYTITIPMGSDTVEWSFDNFATVAGSVFASGAVTITVPAPTPNPPGFVTTTVRFRTKNAGTECVSGGLNRSVRFYPPATADAGADAAICYNGSHTLDGAIGGGATTGSWSANVVGGSFSPDNSFANALTYTPPVNYSGDITLTLTTNVPAGPCGSASDAMVLTVYGPLNTSITGATNVCINGGILLTGSTTGGSGTILSHDWTVTPGTGDATITTGAATATLTGTVAGTVTVTYTVTDDAGCVVESTGTLAVTVDAAPTLTACPGDINLNTDLDDCTNTWTWTHPNVLGVAASCAPATLEVDYGLGNGFETITPATSASQSFPTGTTTVSYKLTDGVGNMATCSFEVTVNDNQIPVITTCPVTRNISGCLTDITGPIYSTTSASSTYAEFSDATNQGVASDNCPLTVSYQDAAAGTCPIVVTRTWTISDGTNSATCEQTINVTPPVAAFAATSNISIPCGSAPPSGTALSYTNSETGACEISGSAMGMISGGHDECGGSYTETWTYVDDCGRTITNSRTISVDPAPLPVFEAVSDITISCDAAPPAPANLSYTNGASGACLIASTLAGTLTGSSGLCGGSFTETWEYVTVCGDTIRASRVITVDPAPLPVFEAVSDITISCDAAPPAPANLSYTNGASGACLIAGTLAGTLTGSSGLCGGSFTETWEYVTVCGDTIRASRVITVDPAPLPVFEAVSDITISCDAAPPAPANLSYTNSASGSCSISGSVTSTISGTYTTCGDEFTETWTYMDSCGRTITASRTITVVALALVVLDCPDDAVETACQDQDAIDEAYAEWLDSFGFSGGCNANGSFDNVPAAPSFCGGTISVTYRVSSDCEDDQTCTRMFTVISAPAIQVVCPVAQTQVLNASCQAMLNNYTSLLEVTDTCGEYSVSQSPAPGTLFNGVQVVLVTLTVTDNCATSSCSFSVSLVDNTPPVAVCPSNIMEDTEPDECAAVVTFVIPDPNDNCAGATSIASPASGSVFQVGTTIVTVTATDASMNTSTCSFTVQVNDVLLPSVVCPSAMVRTFNDPGQCSAVINYSGLISASDNCTGVILSSTPPSGSAFPVGFTVVTVTATDASGNTSTCTFTIGVADNQPPTIVCPANQEIPANASCSSALGSWSPVSLSDNCTPPASIVVTQSPLPSTILIGHNSATLVTLTAQDARGNTSSCTFTVTLKDVTLPTALCKNATVSIGAGGFVVVTPSLVNNGSFDNCGLTLSLNPNTFTCDDLGPNTVTLVVTDVAGNTASCTAVVTVLNNSAPTASCKNATIYLDYDGLVTLDPSQVDNGSSDACGPPASLSVLPSQFNCSDITSPKTVTLTVTSSNGSSSTCTASVTVLDTIPPEAICADVTVMLRPTGNVTVFGATLAGGSTDNCSVSSYSPSAKVYTTANIGVNYLTITVSDFSGNTATCVSEVTVIPYSPGVGEYQQGGDGKVNNTQFIFDLLVYPNPTQSHVTLAFELPYEQTIMVRLFDLSGRMVLLHDDIGLEGANALQLRLDGLAPGMYILDFQSADGTRAVKRLLVQE